MHTRACHGDHISRRLILTHRLPRHPPVPSAWLGRQNPLPVPSTGVGIGVSSPFPLPTSLPPGNCVSPPTLPSHSITLRSSARPPGSSLLTAPQAATSMPSPLHASLLLFLDRDLLRGTCEPSPAAGEPPPAFRPLPPFSHLPGQGEVPANRRGPRARNLSPTLPLTSCMTLGGGPL